mmetsp:Transcript_22088/g.61905  ORF Transcript_22088/g.61905 Transcript_22088/m.61905 type:complete len:216 (-) Transcript_22088:575-1222(-)
MRTAPATGTRGRAGAIASPRRRGSRLLRSTWNPCSGSWPGRPRCAASRIPAFATFWKKASRRQVRTRARNKYRCCVTSASGNSGMRCGSVGSSSCLGPLRRSTRWSSWAACRRWAPRNRLIIGTSSRVTDAAPARCRDRLIPPHVTMSRSRQRRALRTIPRPSCTASPSRRSEPPSGTRRRSPQWPLYSAAREPGACSTSAPASTRCGACSIPRL